MNVQTTPIKDQVGGGGSPQGTPRPGAGPLRCSPELWREPPARRGPRATAARPKPSCAASARSSVRVSSPRPPPLRWRPPLPRGGGQRFPPDRQFRAHPCTAPSVCTCVSAPGGPGAPPRRPARAAMDVHSLNRADSPGATAQARKVPSTLQAPRSPSSDSLGSGAPSYTRAFPGDPGPRAALLAHKQPGETSVALKEG